MCGQIGDCYSAGWYGQPMDFEASFIQMLFGQKYLWKFNLSWCWL